MFWRAKRSPKIHANIGRKNLFVKKCISGIIAVATLYGVLTTHEVYLKHAKASLAKSERTYWREVEKPEITECGLRMESRISSKPLINLRKDRFLFPMLCNGPTNQLVGMRDTIYLAILLNRTVIMPKFRKHFTDSTGALDLIEPEMRVDVSDMTSLASTVDHSALWEECGNRMDIAFKGRDGKLAAFAVNQRNNKMQNVTVDFADKEKTRFRVIGFASTSLATHFQSDLKCAGYVCPYRGVGVTETPRHFNEAKRILAENELPRDVANMPRGLLYSMVFLSSGKPRFVKEISQNFIDDVMGGGNHVAIHWRYDLGDWFKKCKNNAKIIERCHALKNITGAHIFNAALDHVGMHLKTPNVTSVYFASPPNQEKIISQVREAARRHIRSGRAPKVRLYQFDDLQNYLKRYRKCSGLSGNLEDVLGSVESEICVRSQVFFFSPTSSWSLEVVNQRKKYKVPKLEINVLSALKKLARSKNGL